MEQSKHLRRQILEVGKKLTKRQFVAGSDGNISARVQNGQVLITPSGLPLGDLDADELLLVDLHGKVLEGSGRPSSESAAHLYIYQQRPDVLAIVHSHAPHATAFAMAGVELEWRSVPELVAFVGPVALTSYAPPGTDEVPIALEPLVKNHNAYLLRNHGLITTGGSVSQAWRRHETVEHAARILYLSRALGGPKEIPASELHRLTELRLSSDQGQD